MNHRAHPVQAHVARALVVLAGAVTGLSGGCASAPATAQAPAPARIAIVNGQRVRIGGGEAPPAPGVKRDAPAPAGTGTPDKASPAPLSAPMIPLIPMGDDATIARIIDEGKHRNQVMNHLSHLSLEIGARLTGSTNAETANRWAMNQFAAWGLSNPHLEQWGMIAARFDRGPSTGRVLLKRETTDKEGKPATEDVEIARLDFTTLAWVRGTSGPVRGPVLAMPQTDAEFDAAKDRLAGAWLLIPSDPSGRSGVRGIGGLMKARAANWADIRARLANPAAMAAAVEKRRQEAADASAKAAAPDDGFSGLWKGTMTGPRSPSGAPLELTVDRAADGTISGTMEIPGYRSAPIKDARLDGQTLAFTWESTRGDRPYAVQIAGQSMSGQAGTEDSGGIYTLKLDRATAEPPAQAAEGPTVEERILAAGPAGFISGSGDERVWTTAVGGWMEANPGALGQDIEVNVSQPGFETLSELVKRGAPADVEIDLRHTFTPSPDAPAGADAPPPQPIPVYNTVAEIRGTQWPEQVVIISAHLDSWNGPGSTGTIDNGTGSSVTLEAARILAAAGAKPKRTIRFILWTGEEQGLLGSAAYVKAHKDELANISCVLVDDGGTNYEGGIGGADVMVPMLANATAPVNDIFYSDIDGAWLNVNTRSTGKRIPAGGGSDHASFNAAGVPGFFWDEVGRADYGHGWHTQFDRLDQAIPEYLVQSSTCAAVTAYNLACSPTLLPRSQPDAPAAPAK